MRPASGYTAATVECTVCHANDDDPERYVRLERCPMCHKLTCDNCGIRAFGRVFCSKKCSDAFFFGDDEDE